MGSIVVDNHLYAISEGEWYQLDSQFKKDVDENFNSVKKPWSVAPETLVKKVSPDGKKHGFESEFDYNVRCAQKYGQICLDRQLIKADAAQRSEFEACDLLDISGKRLIHVKKSSRQSSVLSHFFKQGSNSARILRIYPEARAALVECVRKMTNDTVAQELKDAIGEDFSGWCVEYHIADAPRKNGEFEIPFFSRITLRDEARDLRSMTFDVALRFIKAV